MSTVDNPTAGMPKAQRYLLVWQAFVTFCMTLTAGAILSDIITARWGGLAALTSAALNAATTTYVAGSRSIDGRNAGTPAPG